ncbi:hypothetical protein GOODEAATRI_031373 [Goodea atripinnis]|uniref:Uncharacterized protein n=1 Tax=Goodea atripinnis TaxID=208336 RepID=A0ABV0NF78_9TELE
MLLRQSNKSSPFSTPKASPWIGQATHYPVGIPVTSQLSSSGLFNHNKTALLKQGRKLKGSIALLREHLTELNARKAKKARELRKQQTKLSLNDWESQRFITRHGGEHQHTHSDSLHGQI